MTEYKRRSVPISTKLDLHAANTVRAVNDELVKLVQNLNDVSATQTGTQTLTNKTLTSPTITGATISSGTISSPVITSATISSPTLSSPKISGVAFASLPTGVAGMYAYVTDSNTVTWGAAIGGGSTNKVLAFYNGTNWTVAGK